MSSALFQQVVEATRGEYVLHGTLGQSDALGSAFLAREVATGRSVLLVVPPDAESLDVIGALSDSIPADAGGCAACGFRVGTWLDACPKCDHVLVPPAGSPLDVAALREQLRDTLNVVGSLPHVRGGTTYFATDVADGRLAAFVIRTQPDGQLGLDMVWEAVQDAPPVVAPRALPPSGQTSAPVPSAHAPAPYADAYAAVESGVDAPRPRRRWLPIGLGVGAVAVLGAAAFAFTRRDAPAPAPLPRPDSGTTVTPLASNGPAVMPSAHDSASTSSNTGTSVLPINNDSVLRVRQAQQEWRRRRDSARTAQLPDVLTIDDANLPSGWAVTVNGGSPTNARDVQIPLGGPAVIRIEAPGYCADTLPINPAPRGHQHWAPTLRGRPTVGEC